MQELVKQYVRTLPKGIGIEISNVTNYSFTVTETNPKRSDDKPKTYTVMESWFWERNAE